MKEKTLTKTYQIIIQDEFDNLYHIGFYKKLEDGLEDINYFLKAYETQIDELKEYSGTFGMCFDKNIEIEDGGIMIRGFIFENDNQVYQLESEDYERENTN